MNEYASHTHWIWSPSWQASCHNTPSIMFFRRTIFPGTLPKNGTIRISADTSYKLYVNGILVETGPSRGDRQVWFCDTVDLLPFLTEGRNVIAVSVLRYPANPLLGNHGMFRTPVPGLFVSGVITDADGIEYDISADEKWKCMLNPYVTFYAEEERFAPLIIHEQAAGNRAIAGWNTVTYNDSDWEAAAEYPRKQVPGAVSPGNLLDRTIPYMYREKKHFLCARQNEAARCSTNASDSSAVWNGIGEEEWIKLLRGEAGVVIPAHTRVSITLDAGEEMTAYMHLAIEQGCGSTVTLLYAEAFVLDGFEGPEQIPVKGDRTDTEHGHLAGYTDTYSVDGYGTADSAETYEPYWFRTFRFVKLTVETKDQPLFLRELDFEETGYPLKVFTHVSTSDETLPDVWEISERTLRRCMHETYVDCPYYEQLQYIMDARSQILYTYAISADDSLARKCIDDLARSQRYDGLLNCSYPNMNPNVIPGFSIYYILMVHDHMMYFGDTDLVAAYMGTIDRILHFFEMNLTPEGYVGSIGGVNEQERFWSYIDWAASWNESSGMPTAGLGGRPVTMETLLYIYGLQHAARLAAYIGRNGEAERYRKMAQRAGSAVMKYCRGRNGMITDGPGVEEYSQHVQVFAILTGLVSPEEGRIHLQKTIVHPDDYAQCTVAMRFYLFRALEMTGLYACTDRYYETWRRMIRLHCTTSIESETYARSECHAWGALILYELPSVTLGVRPAEPGYRKIRICPVPGYMTRASGTVRTPKGDVTVSWRMDNGRMQLQYELPEGLEAEVVSRQEQNEQNNDI